MELALIYRFDLQTNYYDASVVVSLVILGRENLPKISVAEKAPPKLP